MRIALWLLPTSLVLMAGSPATETRSAKLAYGAKLWVNQVDGAVRVQGWEKEEVELQATFKESSRGERCQLVMEPKEGGLEIRVIPPEHHLTFGFYRSAQCHLTLKVPRKLNLAVQSVDGNVEVRDLEGFARCETVDGSILMERIKGEAYTHTVDGHIDVSDLNARLKGGAVDGPIRLRRVEGGIDLHTVDGRIEAEDLNGWGEGIRLSTVDGSIRVKLGGAKGHIEARTSEGRIELNAPTAQVEEQKPHHLRATIPGRDQKITLKTMDGSIRIE